MKGLRRRKQGVVDRRLPRNIEPAGSVGCALFLVAVALFTFAGTFSMLGKYIASLPVIHSLQHLGERMATTEFWSPGAKGALNAAQEEEALERMQREEERRLAADATRRRIDEFLPQNDPESLKLVSEDVLHRMEEKLGTKITGLSVISEKGRMFLSTRPFDVAHPIVQLIFTQKFNVKAGHVQQEEELLQLIHHERSQLGYNNIPRVVTHLNDVMTVTADPSLVDESYIAEAECERLRKENNVQDENFITYLRALARAAIEGSEKQVAGTFTFDSAIIRSSEQAALDAIRLIKENQRLRWTAVRVQLPRDASEFFAEQVFISLLTRMVEKVFGDADKGTKYENIEENHDFSWVFEYAVESRRISNGTSEVLLVVAKRKNSRQEAERYRKLHEKMEQASEEYQEALKRVKLIKEGRGHEIDATEL